MAFMPEQGIWDVSAALLAVVWCPEVQCKHSNNLKVYIEILKGLEATSQNKNWSEPASSGVPYCSFFFKDKKHSQGLFSGLILVSKLWLEYFSVCPHICYNVVSRPWANASHVSSTAEHCAHCTVTADTYASCSLILLAHALWWGEAVQ